MFFTQTSLHYFFWAEQLKSTFQPFQINCCTLKYPQCVWYTENVEIIARATQPTGKETSLTALHWEQHKRNLGGAPHVSPELTDTSDWCRIPPTRTSNDFLLTKMSELKRKNIWRGLVQGIRDFTMDQCNNCYFKINSTTMK